MKKLNRREFVQTGSGTALASSLAPVALAAEPPAPASKHGSKKFKIAIIGVGNRGRLFLKASLDRFNVDVPALCDFREEAAQRGSKMVQEKLGYEPEIYTDGPNDYKRLLKRDDVDVVFITTPTWWHGPMAIDSLRAHKHVFSEVPACNTIQEGWDLVRAAQETDAKYFMAENLCFLRSNMMILNAVEQGVFGTLSFAECGYIHEARNLQFNPDGSLNWRGSLNSRTDLIANTYPTHALGPTSMWFGIPRGDQLRQCVTMMTPAHSFRDYAIERFGPDTPGATATWNGDNTVSLIRTESGAVIFLRFDICSPRPHHMDFYTLQGTKASYDDEAGMFVDGRSKDWEPVSDYYERYDHPFWTRHGKAALRTGHGGGDYFVIEHFYKCLREDRPPGIDVYDAVTWSSLIPLSAKSVRENGATQEVPDYTEGRWKNRRRYDWSNG